MKKPTQTEIIQGAEFQKLYLGDSQNETKYFTDLIMKELAGEFSIMPEYLAAVQSVLEAGSHQYVRETKLAKLNYPSIRRELDKVTKSATKLADILDLVSDDTWQVFHPVSVGLSLVGSPLPVIIKNERSLGEATSRVLQFEEGPDGTPQEIEIGFLQQSLNALAESMKSAKPFAGAAHNGRPADEATFDLLHIAFHVWESLLRRDFALDWADDSEPITPTARFCTSVARAVDPDISLQRIATAARKTREIGIPINCLEEVDQVVEEYHKRIQ